MLITIKIWILLNMLLFSIVLACAQDQKPIDVPFATSERAAMLEMCEAAKYGYAAQFTPICPLLKRKFEEAEKIVAQKAEPKQQTPCAPNECPTKPLTKD